VEVWRRREGDLEQNGKKERSSAGDRKRKIVIERDLQS